MTDPVLMAGLIVRQVRTGERAGIPTRTTVANRTYRTDQRDLWDAVTNEERIPRWFSPVSGTLALGGKYHIEDNASGTIETCVEPESFSLTWEYGGSLSWVSVSLAPDEDGTRLELAHESPVNPWFWGQYGPGAAGLGWDLALVALGMYLEEGTDREQQEAFAASPEGLVFLQTAGANWGDAAIADGDEEAAARTAAEQSIAFYTPEDGSST